VVSSTFSVFLIFFISIGDFLENETMILCFLCFYELRQFNKYLFIR